MPSPHNPTPLVFHLPGNTKEQAARCVMSRHTARKELRATMHPVDVGIFFVVILSFLTYPYKLNFLFYALFQQGCDGVATTVGPEVDK